MLVVDDILSLIRSTEFFRYLSIPLVAAIIGWGTNWLAIKLMFYPLEFVGIRKLHLGWQGIVPSRAVKMSRIVVEKGLNQLVGLHEVFEQVDMPKLEEHIVQQLRPRLEDLVDDMMDAEYEVLWENVPLVVKRRIYDLVDEQLPKVVHDMLNDIENNIERLVDVEDMVASQMVANKHLLNNIFLEAGHKELAFIIRSGAIFGFMFGVLQMVVWLVYPQWWVLPFFGLLVGWATNAIAIKIIFEPLYPVKIGPFEIQGLFLKRQKEVAATLCRITTREIFTISHFFHAMLYGPRAPRVKALIQRHIRRAVDEGLGSRGLGYGVSKLISQATLGMEGYAKLKQSAANVAVRIAEEDPIRDRAFDESQADKIEALLRERMEALSPAEFQGILRPAFQEDEWILIAVGAFLGFVAGIGQLVWVFGESLLR